MKNVMIARGYAGLQALFPALGGRKAKAENIQEITPVTAVRVADATPAKTERARVLAKRNARFARRLARVA
ncbi:MAG: hypothetical protein AAGB16_10775 [Pseudomonadota bacterium]